MIVDGKALASRILKRVREKVEVRSPHVVAIVVDPTPATESYLRIKTKKALEAGMRLEIVRIEPSEEEVVQAASNSNADAVIVQLPLPASINEKRVLNAIPLTKDADVLSEAAYDRFLNDERGALLPPVVCAVRAILKEANLTPSKKRAVVIGNGRLVGAPVAAWLKREGAIVTTLIEENFNLDLLKEAELIVSGAGSPHLIEPSMIAPGAILIDAGTSESNGAIVGDFSPACEEVAGLFTPVPGGVGPVVVACLFENVATLLDLPRA